MTAGYSSRNSWVNIKLHRQEKTHPLCVWTVEQNCRQQMNYAMHLFWDRWTLRKKVTKKWKPAEKIVKVNYPWKGKFENNAKQATSQKFQDKSHTCFAASRLTSKIAFSCDVPWPNILWPPFTSTETRASVCSMTREPPLHSGTLPQGKKHDITQTRLYSLQQLRGQDSRQIHKLKLIVNFELFKQIFSISSIRYLVSEQQNRTVFRSDKHLAHTDFTKMIYGRSHKPDVDLGFARCALGECHCGIPWTMWHSV